MHTHTLGTCMHARGLGGSSNSLAVSLAVYHTYVDEMESVRIVRTYMYLSCMSNLTTTTELLLHACFTVTFV